MGDKSQTSKNYNEKQADQKGQGASKGQQGKQTPPSKDGFSKGKK